MQKGFELLRGPGGPGDGTIPERKSDGMSKKGTVYFFTGLAGAGKTTLGALFYRRMKEKNNDVVLLDGDQLRRLSTVVSGYTTEERRKGAYFNFELAQLLTDQGLDVVLCSISMYDDVRAWAREHIENYVEIYIKVKWDTLYKRDQKGLYSSGTKNVVGVDLLCEEPKTPDFVIENDGLETPQSIVERLEPALLNRK